MSDNKVTEPKWFVMKNSIINLNNVILVNKDEDGKALIVYINGSTSTTSVSYEETVKQMIGYDYKRVEDDQGKDKSEDDADDNA